MTANLHGSQLQYLLFIQQERPSFTDHRFDGLSVDGLTRK